MIERPLDRGGYLAILWDTIWPSRIISPRPPPALPSVTIVTVLDVADATRPTIVHKTHLDGGYVESRRIDDSVFLVLRNDPVRMPVPLRIQEIVAEDGSVLTIAEGDNTVNLNEILDTAQSSKQRYEP